MYEGSGLWVVNDKLIWSWHVTCMGWLVIRVTWNWYE